MEKIILVSPPAQTNRTPEENLGLEYLVTESRQNGYETYLIDAWMDKLTIEQTVEQILSLNPTVIGISPSMDSFEPTLKICQKLRADKYIGFIILGGIYASFEAESLLQLSNDIDGILSGEADDSFQEFLKRKSLNGIAGAVYKRNGKIIKEARVEGTVNLDSLPYPARDNLNTVSQWKAPHQVMGSRGCYGNCSFCSVACFQKFSSDKRWRGRSPESIVKELANLCKSGVTMVKFIDDNFFGPGDKKREKEIARQIIESGMKLRFRLSLRVNDVDEEVIKLLREAGLFAVSLGVESFVQRKLNDFAKGTTVKQNLRAVKIMESNGIYVQMGFIMFDPYVTLEEIKEELAGLKKTRWVVTKGISTKLFAADGTRITERIRNGIGFVGKEGGNNLYEIKDKQAQIFAMSLSRWAKKINTIYEMAIDPISAPKNVPASYLSQFHAICVKLKNLDIDLAQQLIEEISSGISEKESLAFIDSYYEQSSTKLERWSKKIKRLYTLSGLTFYSSGNKRI